MPLLPSRSVLDMVAGIDVPSSAINEAFKIAQQQRSAFAEIIDHVQERQTALAEAFTIAQQQRSAIAEILNNVYQTRSAFAQVINFVQQQQSAFAELMNHVQQSRSAFVEVFNTIQQSRSAFAEVFNQAQLSRSAVAEIISQSQQARSAFAELFAGLQQQRSAINEAFAIAQQQRSAVLETFSAMQRVDVQALSEILSKTSSSDDVEDWEPGMATAQALILSPGFQNLPTAEQMNVLIEEVKKTSDSAVRQIYMAMLIWFILAVLQEAWNYAKEYLEKRPTDVVREVRTVIKESKIEIVDLSNYRIVAQPLVVRRSTKSKAEVVGNLNKGDIVHVVDQSKGWRQVEWHNPLDGSIRSGWVRAKYLVPCSSR